MRRFGKYHGLRYKLATACRAILREAVYMKLKSALIGAAFSVFSVAAAERRRERAAAVKRYGRSMARACLMYRAAISHYGAVKKVALFLLANGRFILAGGGKRWRVANGLS